MDASMHALSNVMTFEPTEVPKVLATSLAPMPNARRNDIIKPTMTIHNHPSGMSAIFQVGRPRRPYKINYKIFIININAHFLRIIKINYNFYGYLFWSEGHHRLWSEGHHRLCRTLLSSLCTSL